MELHVVELWRFSNVNCSIYPIQAVDTIAPDGNISEFYDINIQILCGLKISCSSGLNWSLFHVETNILFKTFRAKRGQPLYIYGLFLLHTEGEM